MPSSATDLIDRTRGAPLGGAFAHGRDGEVSVAPILLRTSRLTQRYASGEPVLKGIDMIVREGETVALVGANGAGKSTLLKTLVGLVAVGGGEVEIFSQTFTTLPSRAQQASIRPQIGFVFQNHGLVKRLSALSNVVHGKFGIRGSWRAWHHTIAPAAWRDEAMAALEAVGLADRASARADRLSGGQAQRVAIARALIRKPRLLIADEPAASLDPAAGHDVMQAFADIAAANGTTLVFTTHDVGHALTYANRVVALSKGRVAIDARSGDLEREDIERIYV